MDRAALVYRRHMENGQARRPERSLSMVASLYAACRERDVPMTLDDLAAASGFRRKEIAKRYRLLVRELDMKVPVTGPANYVAKLAARIDANEIVQANALEILSKAEKAGVTAGASPTALAAAAIYIASGLEGDGLTQKEAADAAGVREATLRAECRRLRRKSVTRKSPVGRGVLLAGTAR